MGNTDRTKAVAASHRVLWDRVLVAPEVDRDGQRTGWALWLPLQDCDVTADAVAPSRPLSALLSASLRRAGQSVSIGDVELVAGVGGGLALELSVIEDDFQAIEGDLWAIVDEVVGRLAFLQEGMRLGSWPVQDRAPRPRLVRRESAGAAPGR